MISVTRRWTQRRTGWLANWVSADIDPGGSGNDLADDRGGQVGGALPGRALWPGTGTGDDDDAVTDRKRDAGRAVDIIGSRGAERD